MKPLSVTSRKGAALPRQSAHCELPPRPASAARSTSIVALLFAFLCFPVKAQNRLSLLPQLHAGQKLTYQIRLRIDKRTRSESRVARPSAPSEGPVDILRTIDVEILDVAPDNPRSKLVLRLKIQDPAISPPDTKALELSVASDGAVAPPPGTGALSAEDTQAWQAWLARFAIAWTFPAKAPKLGEKWSGEEPIAGALLARLWWLKESRYVREEKCPGAHLPNELCAVLLSTATLKQRSSPKDATPDEFKQRDLKTRGTAAGRNETFTYISLRTGIVVRSSEEAHQLMDVIIAKSDGSNQVHYNIDATSSTEMRLIAP
jgi:hypothetical protein